MGTVGGSRGLITDLALVLEELGFYAPARGMPAPSCPGYTCFTKVIQSGLSPTSWVSNGSSDPLAVSTR